MDPKRILLSRIGSEDNAVDVNGGARSTGVRPDPIDYSSVYMGDSSVRGGEGVRAGDDENLAEDHEGERAERSLGSDREESASEGDGDVRNTYGGGMNDDRAAEVPDDHDDDLVHPQI